MAPVTRNSRRKPTEDHEGILTIKSTTNFRKNMRKNTKNDNLKNIWRISEIIQPKNEYVDQEKEQESNLQPKRISEIIEISEDENISNVLNTTLNINQTDITYSNEKVINLTYSPDKTSTENKYLKTLDTPGVKLIPKRSCKSLFRNTSTPFNKEIKSKIVTTNTTSSKKYKRRSRSVDEIENKPKINLKKTVSIISCIATPSKSQPPSLLKDKSAKKTFTRTPMPNFKKIHTKIFNQMESLVDNAERKRNKLQALSSIANPVTPSKIFASMKPKCIPKKVIVPPYKDDYNRFGFKVRQIPKRTALTEIIKNKSTTNVVNTKIETNRIAQKEYIKGVRSNRRFDLLMKSRSRVA